MLKLISKIMLIYMIFRVIINNGLADETENIFSIDQRPFWHLIDEHDLDRDINYYFYPNLQGQVCLVKVPGTQSLLFGMVVNNEGAGKYCMFYSENEISYYESFFVLKNEKDLICRQFGVNEYLPHYFPLLTAENYINKQPCISVHPDTDSAMPGYVENNHCRLADGTIKENYCRIERHIIDPADQFLKVTFAITYMVTVLFVSCGFSYIFYWIKTQALINESNQMHSKNK